MSTLESVFTSYSCTLQDIIIFYGDFTTPTTLPLQNLGMTIPHKTPGLTPKDMATEEEIGQVDEDNWKPSVRKSMPRLKDLRPQDQDYWPQDQDCESQDGSLNSELQYQDISPEDEPECSRDQDLRLEKKGIELIVSC